MFTFFTAGESHGPCLVALIEGVPAGFTISIDAIDRELARRQAGYGRGGRMKIEHDRVTIFSGIRGAITLGSPVALLIENKDWKNWEPYMRSGEGVVPGREVTRPRPGHADLVGGMKYDHIDLRNVLERASARETAVRTAVGGVAKQLLSVFEIGFFSSVVGIGGIVIDPGDTPLDKRAENARKSPFGTPIPDKDDELKKKVDDAAERGETLGGVVEVVVTGLPPGLGSYTQWYTRLDAMVASAVMSIPAVKGVEIGDGFRLSERLGSEAHDEIYYDKKKGYYRETNRAGGLEGGMTTGSPLVLRAAMKPIPTLKKPLSSVDIVTKEKSPAAGERSDVCAVPALAVICEAMVASVIARAFFDQFGGGTKTDIVHNFAAYMKRIEKY
jgi:chorismate synthase